METLIREIDAPALPEDLTVEFFGYPEWSDEGIGGYDYCGQYGNDVRVVPVCEEVLWEKSDYTEEENVAIEAWLNKNYEDVEIELCNQFGNNN